MKTKTSARRFMRFFVDFVAIAGAWALQFGASGNHLAALITAAAVGLYGAWCFYDGITS